MASAVSEFVANLRALLSATHNIAEREIRPSVVFRKVTGGFRSSWNPTVHAGYRSVTSTARLTGQTAYASIRSITDTLSSPHPTRPEANHVGNYRERKRHLRAPTRASRDKAHRRPVRCNPRNIGDFSALRRRRESSDAGGWLGDLDSNQGYTSQSRGSYR